MVWLVAGSLWVVAGSRRCAVRTALVLTDYRILTTDYRCENDPKAGVRPGEVVQVAGAVREDNCRIGLNQDPPRST